MESGKKNSIVNRIISGITFLEINGELYKIVQPDKSKRALAEYVYNKTLEDNKYSEMLTRDQASSLLHSKNIWTPLDEKNNKDLSKYLDDLKVNLYNSLYNKNEQKATRRRIEQVNKAINKNLEKKFHFDMATIEYHAEKIKQEFLMAICIYDVHDNPVYTYHNFDRKDKFILNRFLNNAIQNIISVAEYREIARTEPFRSLWSIGKENTFNVDFSDLSIEQKTLILYSRMYDNVYENPERPSEEVINDDDMLDGWFILEKRKSDKERKQRQVDKMTNKVDNGKGGELFVVANSAEDADQIRDLNDINARMKMRQRDNAVKQKGKLEEHQLPDVQLELKNEAMRQMADRFKRK